ncbi:hypothetical protein KHQ84_gp187 [Rhodococcus phage Finch]|uniref:Uncharacterized protein n=1 Tax=Rhodococcus phage Finch TaxID=2094144 RepID=A0A2P1JXR9_9CAUD|nr:hypothetical protein KHQ84_gp187 [Rhodococcus phage Finch]AVO25112.1 hypothetical protein SEA_FINCH_187 [Rhodococcus phage Finch]
MITISTRSITGIKTESGYVGRYVHYDGYDDARLPVLKALINRDGPRKVGTTIMEQGNRSGWSVLDENQSVPDERNEPERFGTVEGYGVAYRDSEVEKPLRYEDVKDDVFIEYAYFIDMETGDIIWFDHNSGDGEPKIELYAEFKTPTDADIEKVAAQ